jgi:glycosyltransferase involved in cell wall biosynthesis
VAPARYEAYGAGVHEALCCGLPAIVSSTAGVAERYPSSLRPLLLDDPNSASELAARLRHWRDHSAALRAHTLGLSTELRSRSWNDMARDIVSLSEASF